MDSLEPTAVDIPAGEQYSQRFGLNRLWHPRCDYLFAVILDDGRLGWASIFDALTEEQVEQNAARSKASYIVRAVQI